MTPFPFLDQTRQDAGKVAAANPLEIEVAEKLPFHPDCIEPKDFPQPTKETLCEDKRCN